MLGGRVPKDILWVGAMVLLLLASCPALILTFTERFLDCRCNDGVVVGAITWGWTRGSALDGLCHDACSRNGHGGGALIDPDR